MAKTKTGHTTKGLKPPKHHSSKHALKVYWPYLPLFFLLIGGMVINGIRPLTTTYNGSTLAYASEMSRGNLLSSTNSQRSANGVGGLSLNSKLNQAAQNKATDMRNRNYWSHNTPDGEEPWVFIDAVGYSYAKAGENLAYGYTTSDSTVTGWMNSPTHRSNMLDGNFTEVGFGFVNAENFNSSGNQTIVVAMYAKPYAAPAPAPAPQVQSNSNTQSPRPVAQAPAPQPQAEPTPTETTEQPAEVEEIVEDTVISEEAAPITTDSSSDEVAAAAPVRSTLINQLTSGNYLWATTAISLIGFSLSLGWLIKHFVAVRKFIITGEHFVAHHPVFDFIVVAILMAAIYLTQGNGVVL